MKIINYTLFVASNSVRKYLHQRNVDPDTAFLNDYKFMKAVFHILVSIPILKFQIGDYLRLSPFNHIRPVFPLWLLGIKDDPLL
jgi:hypothetical protein